MAKISAVLELGLVIFFPAKKPGLEAEWNNAPEAPQYSLEIRSVEDRCTLHKSAENIKIIWIRSYIYYNNYNDFRQFHAVSPQETGNNHPVLRHTIDSHCSVV